MNLGIIFPLVIYLAFVFGAAIYAYVKTSERRGFSFPNTMLATVL